MKRETLGATLIAAMLLWSTRAIADAPEESTKLAEVEADVSAHDAKIAGLEKKIAALEKKEEPRWLPFVVSGYLQGQYESHADSEDQLRQGGVLLNQDRFAVRRARLKVEGEWEWTSFSFELDGNTARGPSANVHHAEASLLYRGNGGSGANSQPIAKLTMGLFDTPFGFELVESPKTRFFMERSLASRSFFPSEPDVGLRLSGALGWFRYALAVVNGEPAGSKNGFSLQDPSAPKDVVLRVGGEVEPSSHAALSFGASIYNGKGFHRGTDATKNSVVWRDLNENGQIDNGELNTVPALAATPSILFDRWLVGGDLRLRVRSRLGWTLLFAELAVGNNMDRGTFVADPVVTGIDARELGWHAGFVQEIGKHGVVGLRTDYYDPSSDFLDRQGGKVVPSSQAIRTFSPMLGLVLLDRARLLFQYDFVRDHLARNAQGVPIDLKNDSWTVRLQVNL